MIQAVGFDLWETLITDTPEQSAAHEKMRLDGMSLVLREHGIDLPADRLEAAYRGMWVDCLNLYWSLDVDISTHKQIEHLLESAEVTSRDERLIDELAEIYSAPARELPSPLVDGASELLHQLRGRGLKIGLISNTGRTPGSVLRDVLAKREVLTLFDAVVFSNEHGYCKPQRSIFDALSTALRVPAEETVFVGDNIYCDVHGAQQAGMKGVLFIPQKRGGAVAPDVAHGLTITPDATIRDLRQLPEIIDGLHD